MMADAYDLVAAEALTCNCINRAGHRSYCDHSDFCPVRLRLAIAAAYRKLAEERADERRPV